MRNLWRNSGNCKQQRMSFAIFRRGNHTTVGWTLTYTYHLSNGIIGKATRCTGRRQGQWSLASRRASNEDKVVTLNRREELIRTTRTIILLTSFVVTKSRSCIECYVESSTSSTVVLIPIYDWDHKQLSSCLVPGIDWSPVLLRHLIEFFAHFKFISMLSEEYLHMGHKFRWQKVVTYLMLMVDFRFHARNVSKALLLA